MTTSERLQAAEADLATVSVPERMEVLAGTGSVRIPDAASEHTGSTGTNR